MPVDGTIASTGSVLIVVSLGFLLLILPRQYALAPMMIGACYLGPGQPLIIWGAHFYLLRILIVFSLIRLLLRREILSVKLNSVDKVLIAWLVIYSFWYVLFSGDTATLTERLGYGYNTAGVYFLVRAVVRDFDDIILTVKILGIIMIPLAVPFFIEYTTGRNPFFVFGGVPEFTQIREGKLRCQGPFAHPILAGTFGATAMPLFVGLWGYSTRNRHIALGAIGVATFIVFVSSSSGPLLAYLVSLIGLVCWMVKARTRAIRWGIAILLLASHVVMKAPVWFLISRLGEVVGGGGYYRSALIDAFIDHFDEWWLIGTVYTAHWLPTALASTPTMADMVNHYVAQGVTGGLLCLILFIWLIIKCFKTTGKAIRDEARFSSAERFMIWSLGCTMLGHVASFFSVSYFDQLNLFWYLLIGMIAALVNEGGREINKSNSPKGRVIQPS